MELYSIRLGREALSHIEGACRKEWLITNGLGGYASSTVLGLNTRKYHGLLVASLHPPGDRTVFLAKLDEDICSGSDVFRLGTNEFQDGFFPHGHTLLQQFSVSPFPEFVYSLPKMVVNKKIFMPYGKNAVVTLYSCLNNNDHAASIQVFPLVNQRYFHFVADRHKAGMEFSQVIHENTIEISMKGSESVLKLVATDGGYRGTGRWVEHILLREERNRVESCFDDCYQPGYFEIELKPRVMTDFAIVAAAGASRAETEQAASRMPVMTAGCRDLYEKENSRIQNLVSNFYDKNKGIVTNDWLNWLIVAADSFIVKTAQSQEAVIAGYHWFESWGRDTFISLPGLTLVTGRFETAKNILVTFRNYCRRGLIPNFLNEMGGQPAYNTVDATLWFVNAAFQYVKYTDDLEFVRMQMWETLKSIIENHIRGTDFGIRVDKDGLLSHSRRLTWMDAEFNGQAFTPREGKAVEIQALWYNALRIMQAFSLAFDEEDKSKAYGASAERIRDSFSEEFWNKKKNCLYDVVGPYGKDGSVRPNQILAVSLDYPVLDVEKAKSIIDVVKRDLLTPFGLRTLSKDDSGYVGGYWGDRCNRDKAYHNGAVWPWLLGPFVTAFLKTWGCSAVAKESANDFLTTLFSGNIPTGGLGSLNEVFDGDPPYVPRACISQAWSVAEPLRAYVEDVMGIRPKYESKMLEILR